MTVTASERELFFQGKIIEKYGAQYGITVELLDKIDRGTATEDELNTYTQNADKLVMKFKDDLRQTEPENYSNTDLQIVMAMIDANYLHFQNKNESYSKVIPESGVQGLLSMQYGDPSMLNYSALNRHSEDLSPQQIISQFGLDYQYEQGGETVTPYLAKDGNKTRRQPFVFAVETPMNDDIQENAKLPVDPRIMERFESMANDAQLPAQTRQQAKDFLDRNKDNICFIVRNIADQERLAQKYQDKYKIINAQDAPYTGNTAPQYGKKLEGQSAYADVIQEMFLTKPSPVSPGTKIYAKFPKEGVDAERADLPAGSEKVEIAEWNGTHWKIIASDQELQDNFKRTLAEYPDSVKQQWETKTFNNKQLGEWQETGRQKTFLPSMQKRYEADFVQQLSTASNGAIDAEKAKTYFKDFANSLYRNRIPGLGKGYGAFSEERRQELVDSFAEEVSGVITSLGKIAAQGQTFLWSDARIGMFAAAEQDIREAAGVLGAGESLEQTNIGKLWNKLEVIQKPDEAIGLNWDRSSQVWNSISKEFAVNATGDVHVFLPKDIGALSIFWNVELPELRKRMSPFTDSPSVNNITIHHPTDQALTQLRAIDSNNDLTPEQKKERKKNLMTVSSNWEQEGIMDASFQVQRISEKQKEAIRKTASPWSVGLMEVMTERDKTRKSITLNKLRDMGNKWRSKDNFPKMPQSLEKHVVENRSELLARLRDKISAMQQLRRRKRNRVQVKTNASNN